MTAPTPPAAPAPEAPPAAPPAPPQRPPADPDRGFPAETPLAEMSKDEQIAYWQFHSRKHEATAKARGDYDELREKAAEADRLRQERESETERLIREAKESTAQAERMRYAPQLVGAEFRAAARGVLTDEQRDALLEDLDLTKYLTPKGEVDVEKVERKVKAFAPSGGGDGSNGTGKGRRMPPLGQGTRDTATRSQREIGQAEAERRFGKSAAAS